MACILFVPRGGRVRQRFTQLMLFAADNEKMEDGFKADALCSALSAMCTTIVTNPVDVIRTRLLAQPLDSEAWYPSAWRAFRQILAREGVLAFYKGINHPAPAPPLSSAGPLHTKHEARPRVTVPPVLVLTRAQECLPISCFWLLTSFLLSSSWSTFADCPLSGWWIASLCRRRQERSDSLMCTKTGSSPVRSSPWPCSWPILRKCTLSSPRCFLGHLLSVHIVGLLVLGCTSRTAELSFERCETY